MTGINKITLSRHICFLSLIDVYSLGPVIYEDNENENETSVNRVIGIVSFGFGCGKPNVPGYYAPVHPQIDWIKGVMKNTNKCSNFDKNKEKLCPCSSNTFHIKLTSILYIIFKSNILIHLVIS